MPKSKPGYAPMASADDSEDLESYGGESKGRRPQGSSLLTTRTAIAAAAVVVFLFASKPIVVVPAGHSAVVDFFGHVGKSTIPSGMHFKTLFAATSFFSLKTRLIDVTQDSPTSEGLIVELDVSILFHVEPSKVRELYITVGPHFDQVVLRPEITSAIRSLTARFTAKTLYSAGRDEMSIGIQEQLNEKLKPRGIVIEQALLRKLVLPKLVTTAIEEKLKAEQESQRMEFILTKEKQEAERKRIEAQGISDFQKTVSEGISPELLEWKGIEATERLASSPNTKVVVVGSSKNGLPLILGDGGTQTGKQ